MKIMSLTPTRTVAFIAGLAMITALGAFALGPAQSSAQQNASLVASPSSGAAPLKVSFSYFVGTDAVSPGQYRINFGDGTSSAVRIDCGLASGSSDACPRALVASHTYARAGTYTAQLMEDMCPEQRSTAVECMAPARIVGSATVTVKGKTVVPPEPGVTFTAAPKTGEAPLAVKFTAKLKDPLYYRINFGDGAFEEVKTCTRSSPALCTASHVYAQPGTYTATLVWDRCANATESVACLAPIEIKGKVTIVVTGSPEDDFIEEEAEEEIAEESGSQPSRWDILVFWRNFFRLFPWWN